jgi:GNAT superfamily N-acetyltransferase
MNIVPLADHMTHIDEIAQLHQAEWAHMDKSLTLELRRKALTEAAGQEGIPSIFVAIDNHVLIGSAAIVEHDLDTHLQLGPWISAVFVKEHWRTQGIATKLVERCEAEAKKVGAKKLYLSSEFASGLYEKLGWQTIEICMYKGVKVHIMCKVIAS